MKASSIIILLGATCLMLSFISIGFQIGPRVSNAQFLLELKLETSEAIIWYLGHSGWAVKTKEHFLVFDYFELAIQPQIKTLDNGYLTPSEIRDQKTYVLSTHAHGDHYSPWMYEWINEVDSIHFVIGWNETKPQTTCLIGRDHTVVDGIEIFTIPYHPIDAGVAYLVKVDGLTIYHSGDFVNNDSDPPDSFKTLIDYFSDISEQVDLAFIYTAGTPSGGYVNAGDIYHIKKLNPQLVIPQHHQGAEYLYELFADELAEKGYIIEVWCAEKKGDYLHYSSYK